MGWQEAKRSLQHLHVTPRLRPATRPPRGSLYADVCLRNSVTCRPGWEGCQASFPFPGEAGQSF